LEKFEPSAFPPMAPPRLRRDTYRADHGAHGMFELLVVRPIAREETYPDEASPRRVLPDCSRHRSLKKPAQTINV
jgi:hypothetical protein